MNQDYNIQEFTSFLKENTEPPTALSRGVALEVKKQLSPSLGFIIIKLLFFHAIGSFITLLFCPQFGISITGINGIMTSVMQIHPALCFFLCGVMWMLVGQALTYSLLTWDEQRIIGQTRWGFGLGIMLLTVLIFGCLGRIDFDWWFSIWALGGVGVIFLFNWKIGAKVSRVQHAAILTTGSHKN